MHASVSGLAGGIRDICVSYRGRTDVPHYVLMDLQKIFRAADLIQDAEQKCDGCGHRLYDHVYGGCNVSLPPPPNASSSDVNRTKCGCDMFRRKED